MWFAIALLLNHLIVGPAAEQTPNPVRQLVFPLQAEHSHGSCVVECPNGDLLCCWYQGSGERSADDCRIMGARLTKGKHAWSKTFVMADTPDLPDTNPCMTIDSHKRLWLIWPTILDNQWESALLKLKISSNYGKGSSAPKWDSESVVHIKPGPEFTDLVRHAILERWSPKIEKLQGELKMRAMVLLKLVLTRASNKLNMRLGWMPRAHPIWTAEETLLLPLYSDGFSFSLMAMTSNSGQSWTTSEPIVGEGNVQPSVVRRKDGTLVAYMRDNGPPPKRVIVSESTDEGKTWAVPTDSEIVDPGAGVEAIVLKSGLWAIVHNDAERGRHSLAVSISKDEGKTWTIARHLQHDDPNAGSGYSYPSIIQSRDGVIHVTYSFTPPTSKQGPSQREAIMHVKFDERWLIGAPVR